MDMNGTLNPMEPIGIAFKEAVVNGIFIKARANQWPTKFYEVQSKNDETSSSDLRLRSGT